MLICSWRGESGHCSSLFLSLISELEAHSIEGCALGTRKIERTRDKEVVRKPRSGNN